MKCVILPVLIISFCRKQLSQYLPESVLKLKKKRSQIQEPQSAETTPSKPTPAPSEEIRTPEAHKKPEDMSDDEFLYGTDSRGSTPGDFRSPVVKVGSEESITTPVSSLTEVSEEQEAETEEKPDENTTNGTEETSEVTIGEKINNKLLPCLDEHMLTML